MKHKSSLIEIFYKKTVLFFLITLLAFIIYSFYSAYSVYMEDIKKLETKYLSSTKESLKSNVDFFYKEIISSEKKLKKQIEDQIKEHVYLAHDIASGIYKKSKNKEEAQALIIEALRMIRFNNKRDYIYMTKLDGTQLLIPDFPHFEGKNISSSENEKFKKVVQKLINIAKLDHEGYYEYDWRQNDDKKYTHKKISFIKYFEPLDCFIGAGIFLEDIQKDLQENIITKLGEYRFGEKKDQYIFAATYDGLSLNGPAKGKNVLEHDNPNVVKVVKELIKTAKNGSGYVRYYLPMGKEKGLSKISYVIGVKDWNWYIGAGSTIENINEKIEKNKQEILEQLYKKIIQLSFYGLVFLFIFYLLSYYFKKKINHEINRFIELLENLIKSNKLIDTDDISFMELDRMARHTNKVVQNKINIENKLKKNEIALFEQEKLASMGEMIGNIAHQWRQPLSIISTAASGLLLKKEYGILEDAFMEKTLNEIENNAQYLSKTIDTFRNFLKEKKELREVILQERIKQALGIVEATLRNNYIELHHNLDEVEPIKINLVVGELSQVLLNIINNAKDAIKENHIEEPWIKVHLSKNESNILLSIEDNGGGIPKKILPKIFEPYFTTKHESQGTGLGLHMSYLIISESLKGRLYVENTSNGAKFIIELPINEKNIEGET